MENNIFYRGQVLWSMIDVNGHLRHSAYADLGAQARVNALQSVGLDKVLYKQGIGPILFKEELTYLKEIRMNEMVYVTAEMVHSNEDLSRYSIRNEVFRADGTKCASILVEGAWLDIKIRKLTSLPAPFREQLLRLSSAE